MYIIFGGFRYCCVQISSSNLTLQKKVVNMLDSKESNTSLVEIDVFVFLGHRILKMPYYSHHFRFLVIINSLCQSRRIQQQHEMR